MANKKNWLGILALVLVLGALMSGCSPQNPLVGTWVGSNYGFDSEGTYSKDGTYTETTGGITTTGTYTVEGNKCTITVEGIGSIDFDFEVNGNELTYTLMDMTFTYTRK